MIENRKHFRIPFNKKIVFGHEKEVMAGVIRNLSSGGLFVESLHHLRPETKLRCIFELGEEDPPISCYASVKRVKNLSNNPEIIPGLALQFIKSNPQDTKAIEEFMEKVNQNLKVASALLSSGEPDLLSLTQLIDSMHMPAYANLGELRFFVERTLQSIDSTEA